MHLNVYIVIIFMQASLLVYALQLKSFITLDCKCDTVVLYKQIYKIENTQKHFFELPDICMTLGNLSSLK